MATLPTYPKPIIDKSKLGKVLIDYVLRKLTKRETSTECGWAYLRRNQLRNIGIEADVAHNVITDPTTYNVWNQYDTILLDHGATGFPDIGKSFGSVSVKLLERKLKPGKNYKTTPPINIFNIHLDETAWYINRFAWPQHKDVNFISMDYPMIPYGTRAAYKIPRDATSQTWKNTDWDAVQKVCDKVNLWMVDPIHDLEPGQHRLVIGDSHASSAYVGGSMILRRDGRTMHGITKLGIMNEVISAYMNPDKINAITAYYGNIDIRHHLCRQVDPKQATIQLVKNYGEMLSQLNLPIELVEPLPIEHESRNVPKAGWYGKNIQTMTPFYGTWKERNEVMHIMKAELNELAVKKGWDIFKWPSYWYEMDPLEFFNVMEVPRNIHLAWKYYRWDLINNCLNTRKYETVKKSLIDFE